MVPASEPHTKMNHLKNRLQKSTCHRDEKGLFASFHQKGSVTKSWTSLCGKFCALTIAIAFQTGKTTNAGYVQLASGKPVYIDASLARAGGGFYFFAEPMWIKNWAQKVYRPFFSFCSMVYGVFRVSHFLNLQVYNIQLTQLSYGHILWWFHCDLWGWPACHLSARIWNPADNWPIRPVSFHWFCFTVMAWVHFVPLLVTFWGCRQRASNATYAAHSAHSAHGKLNNRSLNRSGHAEQQTDNFRQGRRDFMKTSILSAKIMSYKPNYRGW